MMYDTDGYDYDNTRWTITTTITAHDNELYIAQPEALIMEVYAIIPAF
jgi:hypothetical protein